MKLFHRVILTLAIGLLPVMALWSLLFYYGMVGEINDETDDALSDYAQLIMRRALVGAPLPQPDNGSNNSYSIVPVSEEYVRNNPQITFYDEMVYIPEKEETEPARVLKTIYCDGEGQHYELQVATPTFERKDLLETVAYNILGLYTVLMLTILAVVSIVYYLNMRPLYTLLKRLDKYRPGTKSTNFTDTTTVVEFRKLNDAVQKAMERAEYYFDRQNSFIGNASHELQTPLAILGTRLEWLMNSGTLSEEQMTEIIKMQRSLSRLVRLNRTLLLLSKIENGQFPETTDVNIAAIIRENIEIYSEIYADREISCTLQLSDGFKVSMNESLATTLISNLLKNSFVHNSNGGCVKVSIEGNTLTVANSGNEPLDASRIFERFYHKGNSDSTGLGLPLVSSIAERYGTKVEYCFADGMHCFSIKFMR